MRNILFGLLISLLVVTPAFCEAKVPVLVVDSGTDLSHPLLKSHALANAAEAKGENGKDDDGNGYVDDLFGWNFVENLGRLVNLEFTPTEYDRVLRTLELLGRYQAFGRDNLTEEEFNELRTNYQDKEHMKWIQFTGGWAHGTHVGGIVASETPCVQLKGVTHIPSGQAPMADLPHVLAPLTLQLRANHQEASTDHIKAPPSMDEFVAYFKQQGQASAAKVAAEAKYIGELAPRVINCSFGSDNPQLLEVFKQNMVENWGFDNPSDAQVQELVNIFVTHAMLPRDKALFAHVPNALLVIAAGNSSEDNDGLVISPNNCDLTNTLIIAATNQDKELAGFSCFGKKTVDVAVPGVCILSSYPNGKMGYMSGTSMAAPLASRYAAMVLSVNSELTPQQLKAILMKTVDKKAWLKDKVISGGVINVERAMTAARNVKEGMALTAAVSAARSTVEDQLKASPFDLFTPTTFKNQLERDIYFSAVF